MTAPEEGPRDDEARQLVDDVFIDVSVAWPDPGSAADPVHPPTAAQRSALRRARQEAEELVATAERTARAEKRARELEAWAVRRVERRAREAAAADARAVRRLAAAEAEAAHRAAREERR